MAASLDMATRVAEQVQVIEKLRSDVAGAATTIAERNVTVTQRDATIAQRDATITQLLMPATKQDGLSIQARSNAATAEATEKETAEKKNAERLTAARPTKRKFEKSRIGPELSAAMCGLDMVTRIHQERSPYAAARAALRAEAYHQGIELPAPYNPLASETWPAYKAVHKCVDEELAAREAACATAKAHSSKLLAAEARAAREAARGGCVNTDSESEEPPADTPSNSEGEGPPAGTPSKGKEARTLSASEMR